MEGGKEHDVPVVLPDGTGLYLECDEWSWGQGIRITLHEDKGSFTTGTKPRDSGASGPIIHGAKEASAMVRRFMELTTG